MAPNWALRRAEQTAGQGQPPLLFAVVQQNFVAGDLVAPGAFHHAGFVIHP
ncbi:MAG: hypothetical protein L0332_36030 [Chloroflexi bacterium]|nr:hypothetical protein [Chloroflexota bacterium]MCI0647717.1 hypothetical protein [Chloroflexota bacterium]MCI0732107.1 hypothetical protein [Chloroflexota bacterium]